MLSSSGRFFVLLLLGATIALPLHSQEKPATKPASGARPTPVEENKGSTPPVRPARVDLKKMDLATLPAEAVLILCERANEALELFPKLVLLRPEKYQEMRDEIERLKKQLQAEKPTTPTQCVLRGKVDSGAVRLEAEFAGTTDRPNTLVTLACLQAGVSSAETDGRMARIRRSESGGFLVRIEKSGEYRVKLDLTLSLSPRETNGKGFELTLPRAAITRMELELPADVKDVRVGGRTLKDPKLAGLELRNNRQLYGNPSLEPVEKLEVSWKEIRRPMGEPVRKVEGNIQVRLDAAGLTTEANLLLNVEGTPTNIWRLLVPRLAEVRVLPPDDVRVKSPVETKDRQFASERILHLKEPSAEPLHVQIKLPPQKIGPNPSIGPFFVLDATQHTGTVVVRNRVRNLILDYRVHGDLHSQGQRAAENGETGTVATFVYSNIPYVEKPTSPNALSWLDLQTETLQPQVRTRVSHALALRPGSSREGLRWEIVTTIVPATKWSEGEPLKVFVPPEWQSSDENVTVSTVGGNRCVLLSAPRDSSTQPQRLEGQYEANYKAEGRAVFKLPRPSGTVESCEVKIEAPTDTEAVVNNGEQINLEPNKQSRPNEQTWRCRGGVPEGVGIDLTWRPYRPELRVASVVDVTLNGKHGDVRHEMRVQLPPIPPAILHLRVPESIAGLRVEGGEWQIEKKTDTYTLHCPNSTVHSPSTEQRFVLHYTTPLVEKERGAFAVPLVEIERATVGDIEVRIWSEAGVLPRPASSRLWEERGIEDVEGRRDLPVLVLHAPRSNAPLRLVFAQQAAGFSVLVEHSSMRVRLLESGVQHWHVGYRIRQLADRDLDVVLPAPVATLNAQFSLNGKGITPDLVDEKGEPSEGGNVARLHLSPDLIRHTSSLELSFQSLPSRTGRSPLHTILQPPQIRGAPLVPTRWQVGVPANRVLLAPESGSGVERIWMRRGWLLASGLQRTNGEAFHDGKPPAFVVGNEIAPALICWQDQTAPIVVTQAPQQAWLLVCSLGLLLVGLGLYWAARPRPGDGGHMAVWFWPLLALLTLASTVAALFWPTIFWAIVYGCEPGAVVLLVVLVLQWLRHQRYRRQIVFLPSFSRNRAGSSLVRKPSIPRLPSGEPSTVDAPPPVG